MKLSEFKLMFERCTKHIPDYNDPEVVIVYKPPFSTVGGTPGVTVKRMVKGSDWDNGKFMIYPEQTLTLADAEFEKKFTDLQDKYGWAQYENRNLKADIKKLQKRIDELTAQIGES